jgi:AraC family transcriptional regulator of adaptative response / DNA-3-methyladenine glycosylase II
VTLDADTRRRATSAREARFRGAEPGVLVLRLDYRPPLDWDSMLEFLACRATEGVEVVSGAYRRTVRLGTRTGWVAVTRDRRRAALRAEVSLSLAGALMPIAARLRALFDLDARPDAVASHLGRDRLLARAVRLCPGLRVPGSFDGFETAMRVVLGQQVSVRAATTVSGRIAAALGEPVETPFGDLSRLAPTPGAVVEGGEGRLAGLGMPGARARTLVALAREVAQGRLSLERHTGDEGVVASLREVPGIGDWTAQVVAMRALGDPDAFPAGDLGVRKALGGASAREAEARAENWRPWRAYATMHLWSTLARGAGR